MLSKYGQDGLLQLAFAVGETLAEQEFDYRFLH
jgi:hypothetical protein